MYASVVKKLKKNKEGSEEMQFPKGIAKGAMEALMPKHNMEEEESPMEEYETSEKKEKYKPMGKHMGMAPENKVEIEIMLNGSKKKKKS
jgi:hypothetical protein